MLVCFQGVDVPLPRQHTHQLAATHGSGCISKATRASNVPRRSQTQSYATRKQAAEIGRAVKTGPNKERGAGLREREEKKVGQEIRRRCTKSSLSLSVIAGEHRQRPPPPPHVLSVSINIKVLLGPI